jgi:hypothetical protein
MHTIANKRKGIILEVFLLWGQPWYFPPCLEEKQTSSFSLGQSALSKTCSLWPAKSTVLTPRAWICDPATIARETVGLTVEVSAAKERRCTAGLSCRVNRKLSVFEKLREAILED